MEELAILKKYVCESKDLKVPIDYFFGLFNERKISILPSHQAIDNVNVDPVLELAFKVSIRSMNLGQEKEPKVLDYLFFKVGAAHFYHGAYRIENYQLPIVFFYFADVDVGICATSIKGRSHFFRFFLTLLEGPHRRH